MNDLFRFLLLRPADIVDPGLVLTLTPSFVEPGASRELARREAKSYVDRKEFVTSAQGLTYAKAAMAVVSLLGPQPRSAQDVSDAVQAAVGKTAAQAAADPKFKAEETILADSLVATKLLSDSSGIDAAGLAERAQGYDAIRRAATEQGVFGLRVLSVAAYEKSPVAGGTIPTGTDPAPKPDLTADLQKRSAALQQSIEALDRVGAASFAAAAPSKELGAASPSMAVAASAASVSRVPILLSRGMGSQPWVVSEAAVGRLPASVTSTLATNGVDLSVMPLSMALNVLHQKWAQLQHDLGLLLVAQPIVVSTFGNTASNLVPGDYVGSPASPLPSGAPQTSVRPVGIGDLLLVKQHVLRYEGGDLAHVENVMKSESLSRETRRLERTETTILQETENTKEETQDTQTTDRFSLKRETDDTIKTDNSFKAGLSVDAKYGPFVEVKANADYATSTTTESSTKQASEFSKDVVARSTSKLVERVLERRSVTTVTEFEEKYAHSFDNQAGNGHISGMYQWIDKVIEAQIYNYGKRLLFDLTVPEPGTSFILAQTMAGDATEALNKPPEFTASAADMNEGTYLIWAKRYDATGLEPPPPPYLTISKSIDATVNQDPHESSKSEALPIDDGYQAKYALISYDGQGWPGARWSLLIGSKGMEMYSAPTHYLDMDGETGSIAFAYAAYQTEILVATVEIFCVRTARAYIAWQTKQHAAITQAYLAKVMAYEEALDQARSAAGTVIAGKNPEFNARFVANELRRQCLTLLTAQQFDAFGALELSAEGYAQPNLDRSTAQMPYVRFFEQAFEWEHLTSFFYPYFWGLKKGWKNRVLLDDADPAFGDFLRAGAARVVFPVRPGFEAAVIHYLDSGELWNGGPPPDISSSLYVPIVKEIQEATDAPGDEQPVGNPWQFSLPTTLVRIRPSDDLPAWTKVDETWTPTN